MKEIATGQLGAVLGITARAVRDAVEREDPRFAGYTKTPGGQIRWSAAGAAYIVKTMGREPPAEWLPQPAESKPRKASTGKGAR